MFWGIVSPLSEMYLLPLLWKMNQNSSDAKLVKNCCLCSTFKSFLISKLYCSKILNSVCYLLLETSFKVYLCRLNCMLLSICSSVTPVPSLGAVSWKNYAGSRVSGNLNPREVIIWLLGPKLLDYFLPTLQVTEVLTVLQWNKTVGEVVVTVSEWGHFRALVCWGLLEMCHLVIQRFSQDLEDWIESHSKSYLANVSWADSATL